VTSDDASQLARPKSQRGGSRYVVGTVPTDLSRDRRTIEGRQGGLRGACPPTLSHSTCGVAGEQVEVSHMQYSWRYLVSEKPIQISAVHVFHLILNEGTWRGLQTI